MARPEKKPVKVPKVGDIQAIKSKAVAPSGKVLSMIGSSKMVIGVSIETHDWETGATTGQSGQYCFYTRSRPNDLNARIVKLSWAISETQGSNPVTQYFSQGYCTSWNIKRIRNEIWKEYRGGIEVLHG